MSRLISIAMNPEIIEAPRGIFLAAALCNMAAMIEEKAVGFKALYEKDRSNEHWRIAKDLMVYLADDLREQQRAITDIVSKKKESAVDKIRKPYARSVE